MHRAPVDPEVRGRVHRRHADPAADELRPVRRDADAEACCDAALAALGDDARDDIAVLAATLR